MEVNAKETARAYNADFLTMLETWEAGSKYLASSISTPLNIATLLGWTAPRTTGSAQMSRTASACNAAYVLISAGHITRDDVSGLSVNQVREISTRAQSNMKQVETRARNSGRAPAVVDAAKKQISIDFRLWCRGPPSLISL